MQFSLTQIITGFFFSFFLLLFIVFGATPAAIFVSGAFAVYFLFYIKHFELAELKKYSLPTLLAVLFIIILCVSAVFTHSIPLTINSVVFFVTGYLVFLFVFLLPKQVLPTNLTLFFLIFTVFLTACLFLIFAVFPHIATLPSSNLLAQISGHSHTGYMLLLIIPWVWSTLRSARNKGIYLVALGIFYAALLLSGGRLIWFLSLSQLLAIFLLLFMQLKHKKFLEYFYFINLGILIFTFIILFVTQYLSQSNLPVLLESEARPLYWQQAVQAIQENPLVGYGPGTFSLISSRLAQAPYLYTKYAHNTLLQVAAELGVLGGVVFIWLFAYLLRRIYFGRNQYLTLGITTSIFVAFFDFDWHIAGFLFFLLALMAFQLRSGSTPKKQLKHKHFLSRIALIILAAIPISVTILVVAVEIQILQKKYDLAFKIFPYYSFHQLLFQKQLHSNVAQSRLATIYRFHPSSPTLSLQQLTVLDPWLAFQNWAGNPEATYLDEDQAIKLAQTLIIGQTVMYTPTYSSQLKLAALLSRFSLVHLRKNDIYQSSKLLHLAYRLNPWVLQNSGAFSQKQLLMLTCNNRRNLLTLTADIESKYFGSKAYLFVYIFNQELNRTVAAQDMVAAQMILHRMSELTPDDYWVKQQVENFAEANQIFDNRFIRQYGKISQKITQTIAKQQNLPAIKAVCLE